MPLSVPAPTTQQLFETLSEEERDRARRFHFDHHRHRFIVCRGRQRQILARYLNVPAAEIQFEYGPHGKPVVGGMPGALGVHFNVSNSHELALLAVFGEGELGVDLEHVRPVKEAERIVQRNFSPQEREVFTSLPQEQRDVAFMRCWTRKEAVLKAIGRGLSFPLNRLEVSVGADAPAELLSIDDPHGPATAWTLCNLEPAAGYVGALALRQEVKEVKEWRWAE